MFLRREERRDAKGLSDLLDHFALVADGVVLTSTGLYVAGWEFAGPDMDGLGPDECWQLANRLSRKLQFTSGWTLQCDLIRSEHPEYVPDDGAWPDPVSYLIDQERRARFLIRGEAAPRLSRYFLALSYEPALHGAKGTARWIFSGDEQGREGPGEKALAGFQRRMGEIEGVLCSNLAGVRRLKAYFKTVGETEQLCDGLLEYIRRTITGEEYPFAVPEIPAYLNQYLATDDLTGGAEPQLGDPLNTLVPGKNIAVLAVDGFPARSFAGILRELDSLPFDFRFCQQAQFLDEQEAKREHEANRGKWGFKKTPAKQKLSPIKAGTAPVDGFAAQMEADANAAASAAEHGTEVFVRFSAKVIVMESDAQRLKQAVDAIVRVVKYRCGFSCRIETVNAVAAWLASIPGQHYKDRRTFLVNTENLVDMLPLSTPFRGHQHNPSRYFPPQSPPLFYAMTSGGTAYRFHPHVGDVGHQLIVGPTGSGKTTWLAFAIVQFFRYSNAQVFAFDKKRTLYTLTKAMGGEFYDIGPDHHRTQLCPLEELDTPGEREWAAQWIELLLAQNDLKVTPPIRNEVAEAIHLLARSRSGRSLTDFQMAVASTKVKEAIQFYLGGILDGEHDTLSLSRFCVFEMDELYRLDKKTMNGALFYIFARIRRRLTSEIPTLVTVDEFREALSHELAAKCFHDFLVEGRKLNMAVWFVVQELSKVLASPLRSAVIEQCFTKVLLPNPQAIADGAAAYELLGLNARDRELVAHAEPKSHYYVTSPDGKRIVSLELGQVALSFLTAASDGDRSSVDSLITRYGQHWPGAWLRSRGLEDWAALYDRLTAGKGAAAYA